MEKSPHALDARSHQNFLEGMLLNFPPKTLQVLLFPCVILKFDLDKLNYHIAHDHFNNSLP
ncbi:MAG: hypothetical protein Q8761_03045, partial [Sweet potato little leaf phytoplasma]|nr:hypothetical protein [Sweet potato little leaf phytoplasma]